MSLGEKLLQDIKDTNLPVIIYGCGLDGKILLDIFKKEGIQVEAFCDDNKDVHNRTVEGLDVYYAKEVVKKYVDNYYVISFANVFQSISFLQDNGIKNSAAGGCLIASHAPEFVRFKDYKLTKSEYITRMTVLAHQYYGHFKSDSNKDKVSVQAVHIPVSTYCTLNCKDCAALIPRFKTREHYDIERIIKNLDNMLKYVDEIYCLTLTGGDPLLNKDWYKLVDYAVKSTKIKQIYILTTGMIKLEEDKIHYLSSNKVQVHISDYGDLSKGMLEFADILEKNKVYHFVHKDLVWFAPYDLKKMNRSDEENTDILGNCASYGCYYLNYEKVFRCALSSIAYRLGYVDENPEGDYMDLAAIEASDSSREDKKQEVWKYFNCRKLFSYCDYCDSLIDPQKREVVTAAIQG